MKYYKKNHVAKKLNILDVGGGTGLILKKISIELEKKFGVTVDKFALDLSPKALEIQKKTNPDLSIALNQDICNTTLQTKEIDLTLMIDVLEHIPDPTLALKEVKRVSKFVIFKVPLEDNLFSNIWNVITKGKYRQGIIEKIGHINTYSFNKLKHQIEKHSGKIIIFNFTNIFQYRLLTDTTLRARIYNSVASFIYRISPKMSSLIFYDFVMMLIKCY